MTISISGGGNGRSEIQGDVPPELESEFKAALERLVSGLIEELEFSVTREILSGSKLTEKQALKLAEDVKKRVAKRHGAL